MAKREKRIPVRPPGLCIFCQRLGNLSKEHLWSDWMTDLFPQEAVPAHHEVISVRSRKVIPVRSNTMTRQGGVITKKLRVVCRDCNHGWMKALEEAARPILTPLIVGDPIVLNRDQQKILAEWITLKMMVAEHNIPADVVVLQADRDRFYTDRTIPPYFHIWALSSHSEKWRSRYIRHNATFSLPGTIPASPKKNTQSIAWGVGRLFIFVMMTLAEGLNLLEFINVHPFVLKLFPYSGEMLPLPFLRSIDDASGDRMAGTLDLLVQSPKVIYKDFPL
jgi:hypothetical protein